MKGSGLRIRVDDDLRQEFLETCKTQHRPAAQVLREFMRSFVKKHKSDSSSDTLVTETTSTKARRKSRKS